MRPYYLFLILSLILFNYSCNSHDENLNDNGALINMNIDSILSDNPITFSSIFSDFELIPLQTTEESIFSYIDDIKVIGDTLFIFDRTITKSILLFSKDGKFLNKIKKVGRGPGEYIYPTGFDLDPVEKKAYIFDYQSKNIITYDFNGTFQKSIKLNEKYSSFIKTKEGFYLFKPLPSINDSINDFIISYSNRKGEIKWKSLDYSDFLQWPRILELEVGGNFFRDENDVKFFMKFCNTVYSIKQHSIRPYLVLLSDKYMPTQEDLESLDVNKPSLLLLAYQNLLKFTKFTGFSENDELMFFKFLIGLKEYKVFYFFNTNRIICTSNLLDDFTFVNPTLFRLSDNYLIGFIDAIAVPRLKDNITRGKVRLPEKDIETLFQINAYSNPLIVLYHVK